MVDVVGVVGLVGMCGGGHPLGVVSRCGRLGVGWVWSGDLVVIR